MPRLKGHISLAPKRALIYGIIRFRHSYVMCILISRSTIPGAIYRHLKYTNPLSARGQRPLCARTFSTRTLEQRIPDPPIAVKIRLKIGRPRRFTVQMSLQISVHARLTAISIHQQGSVRFSAFDRCHLLSFNFCYLIQSLLKSISFRG